MNSKSSCNLSLLPRPNNLRAIQTCCFVAAIFAFCAVPRAAASDAPSWMHVAARAPLPAHDDKTDAVELYSERIVTVQSPEKIKIQVREVYKILRPGGRD